MYTIMFPPISHIIILSSFIIDPREPFWNTPGSSLAQRGETAPRNGVGFVAQKWCRTSTRCLRSYLNFDMTQKILIIQLLCFFWVYQLYLFWMFFVRCHCGKETLEHLSRHLVWSPTKAEPQFTAFCYVLPLPPSKHIKTTSQRKT